MRLREAAMSPSPTGASPGTALVTGASVGIGRELARILAREGHDLVIVARDAHRLERLADELTRAWGVSVRAVAKDLARPGAASELHRELEAAGVAVEVLVNNAGFGLAGAFAKTPMKDHLELLQLNMVALTELTKLALGGMVERGRGRILNVASTAAFQPGPYMATYYASKAYVLSFSEALGAELEGKGVSVTALCPGPTATEFQRRAGLEGARIAMLGMMDSETVAEAGYRAMRAGRRLAIPGLRNRLGALAGRLLPRGLVLRMVRGLQRRRR